MRLEIITGSKLEGKQVRHEWLSMDGRMQEKGVLPDSGILDTSGLTRGGLGAEGLLGDGVEYLRVVKG